MNWTKIEQKYPKAWEKLLNSDSCSFGMGLKMLYDFFDEQGIIVTIGYESADNKFTGIVHTSSDHIFTFVEVGSSNIFNSRSEAEEAAFNEAFKILELK